MLPPQAKLSTSQQGAYPASIDTDAAAYSPGLSLAAIATGGIRSAEPAVVSFKS